MNNNRPTMNMNLADTRKFLDALEREVHALKRTITNQTQERQDLETHAQQLEDRLNESEAELSEMLATIHNIVKKHNDTRKANKQRK